VFFVSLEQIFQTVLVLTSASLVGCVQASMKVSIQNALGKTMWYANVIWVFFAIKPPKNAYLVLHVALVIITS